MLILHINTTDVKEDRIEPAYRLIESLKNNGVKARLLVQEKKLDEICVIGLSPQRRSLKDLLSLLKSSRYSITDNKLIDIATIGTDITTLDEYKQSDVINLHHIGQGMLSLKNIRKILLSNKPLVWTLHNMWPFTGVCYEANQCTKYQTECRNCPLLKGSGSENDISSKIFNIKKQLYRVAPITFVATSHWLEEQAKKSELLAGQRICYIPNSVNTTIYRIHTKQEARNNCSLPVQGRLMLIHSDIVHDAKGLESLTEACKIIKEKHPEWKDRLGIVLLGKQQPQLECVLPFRIYPTNFIKTEYDVANVYNAADVYVSPLFNDGQSTCIIEAMACGLPCVGFDTQSVPEIIDNQINGYVAKNQSTEDLANGICWILDNENYDILSRQANHKAVSTYGDSAIAKRYIEIYNKVSGKYA